jgi:hypothetical protein
VEEELTDAEYEIVNDSATDTDNNPKFSSSESESADESNISRS